MEQTKDFLEGLKELKTMQNEIIVKMDALTAKITVVKVTENTTTVEERLSKMEEKLLEIRSKQHEQDQLIGYLSAYTTRLEARINLIREKL